MNFVNKFLLEKYSINADITEYVEKMEEELSDHFQNFDKIKEFNQYKVINALQENRLSSTDFFWPTGYGYGDVGRDKVEAIFSSVFNTEDSLVRPSIASGTHAINLVLSGLLKQGDELIEISGTPYDTLKKVIGVNEGDNEGSLIDRGVLYREVPLNIDGNIDIPTVLKCISPRTKVLAIQRSTGYSDRIALTIEKIEKVINAIKKEYPEIIIFVDNCYGEFTEMLEPTDVGADIIAGSLIKNPGGGIAISGGYITGKRRLVEIISRRLTAPGLEKEVGLTFGTTRNTLQGLFLAPLITNQALKGAVLMAGIYKKLGYKIVPDITDVRADIILGIEFNNPDMVVAFCKAIQEASVVDSYVTPEPWDMPGYENKVVMAAGGFVDGSSIEMSADGPLREPYYVYYQGGLTYDQVKLAAMISLRNMVKESYISL